MVDAIGVQDSWKQPLKLNKDLHGFLGLTLHPILMEREPYELQYNIWWYYWILKSLLHYFFILYFYYYVKSCGRFWVWPTWTWRGPEELEVVCASWAGSFPFCHGWSCWNSFHWCEFLFCMSNTLRVSVPMYIGLLCCVSGLTNWLSFPHKHELVKLWNSYKPWNSYKRMQNDIISQKNEQLRNIITKYDFLTYSMVTFFMVETIHETILQFSIEHIFVNLLI